MAEKGNMFITGTDLHKTYKNEAEPPKKTRIPEVDIADNKEKEENDRKERTWKEIRKRVTPFLLNTIGML